jgi:hypothetical protein
LGIRWGAQCIYLLLPLCGGGGEIFSPSVKEASPPDPFVRPSSSPPPPPTLPPQALLYFPVQVLFFFFFPIIIFSSLSL